MPPSKISSTQHVQNKASVQHVSETRLLIALMGVLTFTTGIVDAVGYLALDHVFIGNMTGNVVILGMALAGGADLPLIGPSAALLSFLIGAALSGMILKRAPGAWSGIITLMLSLAGIAVLMLGVISITTETISVVQGLITSSIAAFAMGIQANTARKLAVRELSTVVVTSTMTAFAGDFVFAGGKPRVVNRRVLAVLAMLLGAAAGAFLLRFEMGVPLCVAGGLICLAALAGHIGIRRRTTQ